MPVVHAESNTLGISIVEQINRADTYHPRADGYGGGTLSLGTVSGTGTVNLTNNAGVALEDINVILVQGNTHGWSFDRTAATDKVTVGTADTSGGVVTIHIPLLAAGQYSIVTYAVDDTVKPPAYLNATYGENKVIAYNGANTTVNLTVTRDNTNIPAADTISSVSATTTPATGWGFNTTSFSFADLTVASPSNSKMALASINDYTQFDGANQVNEYLMATTKLSFVVQSATRTVAGVSVSNANAKTSNILWDIQKQLSSGSWIFTPKVDLVNNGDPITYTLTAVTMWATSNSDLNTVLASTVYDSGTSGANLPTDLTGASAWTGPAWTWNPGAFSGIPVGFVKPSINVKFTPTQFPASNQTIAGATATLAKYIYIANGYLIEVDKKVTPVTDTPGQYDITINVYNKGNKASPDVIVYDIVPSTFSMNAGSDNPDYTGSTNVANVQGVTGTAYWWDVGTLAATTGTATITYRITALDANAYPLTDVYIIGVDPAQSLNLQSSPMIGETEASATANANFEALAAATVAGLFMVGTFGFVARRKL